MKTMKELPGLLKLSLKLQQARRSEQFEQLHQLEMCHEFRPGAQSDPDMIAIAPPKAVCLTFGNI